MTNESSNCFRLYCLNNSKWIQCDKLNTNSKTMNIEKEKTEERQLTDYD